MRSTVMNRVASGKRYWAGKGQELNEHNVIFAPNQYQGVPNQQAELGPGVPKSTFPESNFAKYMKGANDPGARNAAQADENVKRAGKPTNDATFFIVNPGGKPPAREQVRRLGSVMPANPPKVGDVYLYKPKSPARR